MKQRGRPKGSKNKGVRLGNKSASKTDNVGSTPTTPVIKAILKVLGHTYESQGNTPEEVLNNFKTEQWVKGAGVLIIKTFDEEGNERVREKIIAGNHIRNLFGMASGTMREVSLKWVKSLF